MVCTSRMVRFHGSFQPKNILLSWVSRLLSSDQVFITNQGMFFLSCVELPTPVASVFYVLSVLRTRKVRVEVPSRLLLIGSSFLRARHLVTKQQSEYTGYEPARFASLQATSVCRNRTHLVILRYLNRVASFTFLYCGLRCGSM
jgi:hypothetical protein